MSFVKLLDTPMENRDERWEDLTLTDLCAASLELLTPEPQSGPDGWPYLMVQNIPEGEGAEPAQKILDWLATRGVGLALNPHKEYPDVILTWGMIWSFRETGKFVHRNLGLTSAPPQIDYKTLAHAGTPTEQYLPNYVRQILRDFFRDQGVLAPKILVVSQDRKHYELAFSLESLGNPPESEWSGIAEAIAWFLPLHYSVLLVSEKSLPQFSLL